MNILRLNTGFCKVWSSEELSALGNIIGYPYISFTNGRPGDKLLSFSVNVDTESSLKISLYKLNVFIAMAFQASVVFSSARNRQQKLTFGLSDMPLELQWYIFRFNKQYQLMRSSTAFPNLLKWFVEQLTLWYNLLDFTWKLDRISLEF